MAPSPRRLQKREKKCGKFYCGDGKVLPDGYYRFGTRNECLRRGVGLGLYVIAPQKEKERKKAERKSARKVARRALRRASSPARRSPARGRRRSRSPSKRRSKSPSRKRKSKSRSRSLLEEKYNTTPNRNRRG